MHRAAKQELRSKYITYKTYLHGFVVLCFVMVESFKTIYMDKESRESTI